ncbi:hypothetical protein [Vibrio sp. 1-2 (7-a)]|uniref:hypothetical protein n=1 Tax=Vibrio sp. 1-2 (7-a) TaxID=2591010 RepID=UPI0014822D4D|nr:hypothetical protein [Vibrio sp. 1-2 (7-a)]
MNFIDKLQGISAGFFVVAMTSLICITGFVSWATVSLKGAELLFWVSASLEFLDLLWIFSLGIFLGWYLSPQKQPRRDKELRSDDVAPSRPLN